MDKTNPQFKAKYPVSTKPVLEIRCSDLNSKSSSRQN